MIMLPVPSMGTSSFSGTDKREIYTYKIFLFLHENIHCGYSLVASSQCTSKEYHNICFHTEIKNTRAQLFKTNDVLS